MDLADTRQAARAGVVALTPSGGGRTQYVFAK
jgi:hypothetical protein